MAALVREVSVPGLVLGWIAASAVAGIDATGAAPLADHLAPSLTADASFTQKEPPVAPVVRDAVPAERPASETATTETPVAHEPVPVVATPVLTVQPEPARPETSPAQVAIRETGDSDRAVDRATDSPEARQECSATDTCIDRYLWGLYERAPKEDSVKEQEQRKVAVKRKGRMVTVTRTFTKLVDEDFAWKDPKAAERAGMTMMDYVIGGMDRDFKLKLANLLHAADEAGLSPGITSAFRDDYRQSIASGLKAANNRSYHGGSLRGGYGHGLAADIVSVSGATRAQRQASTEVLWKWVDAHGEMFGIGRPYLDHDPPHVGPIDGQEYAAHHHAPKVRLAAASKPKARHAQASRDDHGAAKRIRTASKT
jgi:hypothetical protein